MKYTSLFIKGFEFFTIKHNAYELPFQEIMDYFNTRFPADLQQYLMHFDPVDFLDEKNYPANTDFEKGEIVFNGVNGIEYLAFAKFYNTHDILERIRSVDFDAKGFFLRNSLVPIAESVSDGDIVISVKDDATLGKVYSILFTFDDGMDLSPRYIADTVWSFISNMEVIQRM